MKIIGIDQANCKKCKECIKDCPSRLFFEVETTVNEENILEINFKDPHNACIVCGHCIAVCPTGAILSEGMEELGGAFEFEEAKDPTKIIDYGNILKLLRSRRSIRRFQNKPIPADQVKLILEAMRYAPTASNAQSWNYTVVSSVDKIKYFRDEVMKLFYLIRKGLKVKHVIKLFIRKDLRQLLMDPKTAYSVENIIQEHEEGGDPIFYDGSCVIVLTAPKYGDLAGNDAGIAFTYGMLAAQSLGIGTCWIGFAQEALARNKKLRNWLKIPKNRKCYGVLVLGYPAVRYKRAPPRNVLKVKWVN